MTTLRLPFPNTLDETAGQSKTHAAREAQRDGLAIFRGQFVPAMKSFTLEKRPFVANLCADLDFLA
jgi:hypothetical protein